MARLSIRIDLDPDGRLGPGKVLLLERIGQHGSIAAAGRSLKMSYRRAWELVAELNGSFREPLVVAQMGGRRGGGAAAARSGARRALPGDRAGGGRRGGAASQGHAGRCGRVGAARGHHAAFPRPRRVSVSWDELSREADPPAWRCYSA